MPVRDFSKDACFVCGGTSFDWGQVQDGARPYPHFLSDRSRPTKVLGIVVEEAERDHLRARKCEGCGNVQLFVEGFVRTTPVGG